MATRYYTVRRARLEWKIKRAYQKNEGKIIVGLALIATVLGIATVRAVVTGDRLTSQIDVVNAESTSAYEEERISVREEAWQYIASLELPREMETYATQVSEIEVPETEVPETEVVVPETEIPEAEVATTEVPQAAEVVQNTNEADLFEEENTETLVKEFKYDNPPASYTGESLLLSQELNNYYNPTDEEREIAYKVAFSEAGIEDPFGQTLVINVAINHMMASGYSNLIEEITSGRYSSVKNGVPCIRSNGVWIPVTDSMLSDELKAAVDLAFERDYSEELLKEVAEQMGLGSNYYEGGALYFYNPDAISENAAKERANIKVLFRYGRHLFYRVWDK